MTPNLRLPEPRTHGQHSRDGCPDPWGTCPAGKQAVPHCPKVKFKLRGTRRAKMTYDPKKKHYKYPHLCIVFIEAIKRSHMHLWQTNYTYRVTNRTNDVHYLPSQPAILANTWSLKTPDLRDDIGLHQHSYLIFVIYFTQAKFLENKICTEKRQFFALNL